MAEKPVKLFVSYKTRIKGEIKPEMLEFKAPSNYKDAAKIATYMEERKESFLADAKNKPYLGTFDKVFILDPNTRDDKHPESRKTKALLYADNTDAAKPPVAVRVRNYLTKHYPDAWNKALEQTKYPGVILIGFEPKTFVKMLGLECSMPGIDKPCPVGLWYGNYTAYVDIGEAVCPKDFGVPLPYVLAQRRPLDEKDGKIWDDIIRGWTGPGNDVEQDARIAVELATQLGFLEA